MQKNDNLARTKERTVETFIHPGESFCRNFDKFYYRSSDDQKKSTNCLVVVDRLTKAPLLQNIKEITAKATARRLYETFYLYYGILRAITSDRGI
jgi:hypothetical protein